MLVAAQRGHAGVVHELALLGANGNAKNNEGVSPVIAAADHGHVAVIGELASIHVDLNARLPDGATAMYFAAQNGHAQIVRRLRSLGADVNAARNDGAFPLQVAAVRGHVEVVRALTETCSRRAPSGVTPGADKSRRCPSGRTVYDEVKEAGNTAILDLVVNYPAWVDASPTCRWVREHLVPGAMIPPDVLELAQRIDQCAGAGGLWRTGIQLRLSKGGLWAGGQC